jgi:phenylpropionate dioxygenase-like ring-hydroxylating dioxygenase large terminal subunit
MQPVPESDPSEPPEPWPDGWWALCPSRSLRPSAPLGVRRLGQRLVVWRDEQGAARAAHAACPHRGTDLSLGRVRGGRLECRYHGFQFDGDGVCRAVPCAGPEAKIPPQLCLVTVPVVEDHGFVLAWFGSGSAPPLRWIPDAPAPSAAEAVRELVWPVRFTRAVEAMLDLHHTPFAHPWVTPPGVSRLDPYDARFDDDGVLRSRGRLRREGRAAGYDMRIDLRPPAILHVSLSARLGGVVVVAPVDAESTWIGMRYYARVPVIGALPLVDRAAAELAVAAELWLVQPDDLRMVATAEPRTGSVEAEQWVHADKAIGLWHAWRRRVTREGETDGAVPISSPPARAP